MSVEAMSSVGPLAKADAVILVVDARKFSFENLEHGLAQIRASGANVVGIVLNRVRRRKTGPAYGYDEPSQNWSQSQGQRQNPSTKVKLRRLARSG